MPAMKRTIYTLGYTGLKPAQIAKVAKHLKAKIVDVRMGARSRVAHWNGAKMAENWGEAYAHLPEFGNVNYRDGGSVRLANPERGLLKLRQILVGGDVILLCACREYSECHRQDVARFVHQATGFPIIHLDPDELPGEVEPEDGQQTLL